MFILPYPRDVLMQVIPQGGKVAEIGVAEGEFSKHILNTCNPERLILVDPWVHQDREDYQQDKTNDTNEIMEKRFQFVVNELGEDKRVVIRREESLSAAEDIKNSKTKLDWVYIDAIHSYKGCHEDLCAWSECITDRGMILGHDFALHQSAKNNGIFVPDAVRDFCLNTEWSLVALTNEAFGTYVLMRNRDAIQALYRLLSTSTLGIIQVTSFWSHKWEQAIPVDERGYSLALGDWPISILTIS